jgi:hypothetical protein
MVDFARMLALDDHRWMTMTGGYRLPFDPRPLLSELQSSKDTAPIWSKLWDELHHQGDVGEASYAAVPHLVDIYRRRGQIDWNAYAIVAIIELARKKGTNPDVPEWMSGDYFSAIQELANIGTREIRTADAPETVRAILSMIAIAKGLPIHANFLLKYSEEEMLEFEAHL